MVLSEKILQCSSLRSQFFFFFIYIGFFKQPFTNHRTAVEGEGHFFYCLLPLPPASQTLRQSGDYSRKVTSVHRQQPDSNQEPLVSERKLLTSKLRAQNLPKSYVSFYLNLIIIARCYLESLLQFYFYHKYIFLCKLNKEP